MIKNRLTKFREELKKLNLAGFIIPSVDPHFSEYVPELWQRRQWLSGFDGSAGDLVVTLNDAALWTDSRYFIQAEKQLKNTGIKLMKIGQPNVPDIPEWLLQNLKRNDNLGIDPQLHCLDEYKTLLTNLISSEINIKSIATNPIDKIWIDRPDYPSEPIEVWDEKYAGESYKSKLQRVRNSFKTKSDMLMISALDHIAWLFNIRSNDVEYTPVVIAYALITTTEAHLFVKKNKLSDEVINFYKSNVQFHKYEDFGIFASSINNKKIMVDPKEVSKWVIENFSKNELIFETNPIEMFQAIKNTTEIEGMKNAHIRDGVAMVKFLHWLEGNFKNTEITELSAAQKLENFRKENELFKDLSFETISASGTNGAIVHYTANEKSNAILKEGEIYLVDSGGQYLDGTTDITRTIALGEPSRKAKKMFTLVLKGHIDLLITRFPNNTAGKQLDTIARKPLWDEGYNYGHGTGHGVGTYLGVHEGPHAISYYRCIGIPLVPGMVTSVEPGYYEIDNFGIRIENLAYVLKDNSVKNLDFEFYKFENFTYCPIDKKLINKNMLDENEIKYLNNYHKQCYEKLSPHISDESVLKWLETLCKPI